MKPELQRRVQRYGWDKAAAFYEPYWQRQLRPAQDLLLDVMHLRPGERVLDVACGTGLVTFRAAEAVGSGGQVTGSDISDGMLDAARRLAGERGLRNVAFERADAEELGQPDGQYDAALCSLGLMYVAEPVQALREMHRVLRPGGRAGACVWGTRSRCGWAEIFPIVEARVASDVCPMFFQMGTGDSLEQAFAAAGFEGVRTQRIDVVLHYDSEEEAYGAAFAGGPVALAYAKFDEPTRDGAHAEYLDSIEPYRNGEGYDVPGEFVVAYGEK